MKAENEKHGQGRREVDEACLNHLNLGPIKFFYSTRSLRKNEISVFLHSRAIIIFPDRLDTVFFFYCATQRKKGTMVSERNIGDAYTTKGFNSWKKAPQCFEEYQ